MQLKVRLPQTDPAANLAAGTPSKTRRDFFPRQRAQQTPFRESVRGCGCTKSRCRRFPSHGCSLAGPAPQSSANKEQGLRNYERKKSRDLAIPEYSGRAFKVTRCCNLRARRSLSNRLEEGNLPVDGVIGGHECCHMGGPNGLLSLLRQRGIDGTFLIAPRIGAGTITTSVKKISNRRNMSAPDTFVRFRLDSG